MFFRIIFMLFVITTYSCRDRYGLPMEETTSNLLVVEGNILDGDTTRIRLSRSSNVAQRTLIAESGARLQIEGEENSIFPLEESATEPGLYQSQYIALNKAHRYRLKILTSGKEYESEWLNILTSPEIDSVYWKRDELDQSVAISVASRGSADDSRYFKWDYEEVWEFHSKFESAAYYTYVTKPNGEKEYKCMEVTHDGFTYESCLEPWYYPTNGRRNDSMYTCWKYVNSSNINIGSTAALSENVVSRQIRKIAKNAWELSWLYSILVKQTALSKDGFEFYKILETNSEKRGTIFDAQPGQLRTNLRCVTNTTEPVIGFIDATSAKSKRLFIRVQELPDWRYFEYTDCVDTLHRKYTYEEAIGYKLVPTKIKWEITPPYRITLDGLTYDYCADCRLRGIHLKPDYWP